MALTEQEVKELEEKKGAKSKAISDNKIIEK